MPEKHLLYIIGQSPFGSSMHPSPPFTSEGKDDLKSSDVLTLSRPGGGAFGARANFEDL